MFKADGVVESDPVPIFFRAYPGDFFENRVKIVLRCKAHGGGNLCTAFFCSAKQEHSLFRFDFIDITGQTFACTDFKNVTEISSVIIQFFRNFFCGYFIAYVFEHWGSGIPRIIDKVKAAGLREPEFIGGEVDLRINIYRGQVETKDHNDFINANKVPDTTGKVPNSAGGVPDTVEKVPDSAGKMPDTMAKLPDNEQEQQIFKYVLKNNSITTAKAAELLGVKQRRARAVLMNMVESAYLRKEGAARSTIYVKNTEGR